MSELIRQAWGSTPSATGQKQPLSNFRFKNVPGHKKAPDMPWRKRSPGFVTDAN